MTKDGGKDLYDALRMIVGELESFASDDQKLVIKWATEKLGIDIGPLPNPSAGAATIPPSQTAAVVTATNIKSFVEEKSPSSDNQFAAVVAYFHRFVAPEKKDSIGSDDLTEATRLANWQRLKQPAKTLANACATGLLDNVGRGMYRLNAVGENLVALVLPGGGNSKAPSRKAKARPKKKSAKSKK